MTHLKKNMKRTVGFTTLFILMTLGLKCTGHYVGIGWNTTKSEPQGLYLYYPVNKKPFTQGDLVTFQLSDYAKKINHDYIKQHTAPFKSIGAIPGQWLFTVKQKIYACQNEHLSRRCHLLGRCLKKDRANRHLSCQRWNGYQIPDNYYYLKSNRVSNSFDSRYFGLIEKSLIQHRLKYLGNMLLKRTVSKPKQLKKS